MIFMKGADNMKKLTASILSFILCTSPVIASADTNCLSKDKIADLLKSQFGSQIIESCNNLTLEELLNKFGVNTDCNIPSKPDNNNPTPPEAEKPVVPEIPENNNGNSSEETQAFETEVLRLVNEERTSRGLSPLSYSQELAKVAYSHSKDMADRNYFSHNTPEGLSPFDRMKNAGISYKSAGENIAAGQQTPEAVVDAWMNSDGHRANILNASYTKMGIGYVYGGSYGIYWTQLFAG